MIVTRRLLRDSRGATAAEFAMVLPLLLLLLFGIIDAGRFLWEYNRAEKATQVGARVAAVTDMVAEGLQDYSFALDGSPDVPAGDTVGTDNFDTAVCTAEACTCTGAICGAIGHDEAAYEAIVDRMQNMYPAIGDTDLQIAYRNIGLGYAGDPNGPDVAPLITVTLPNLQFQPITTMLFGLAFDMPDFSASLTAEDADGTNSN